MTIHLTPTELSNLELLACIVVLVGLFLYVALGTDNTKGPG